jgi:hypothetical protein
LPINALSEATSGNVPADTSKLSGQEAISDFIKCAHFGQREFGDSGTRPLIMWLCNNSRVEISAVRAIKVRFWPEICFFYVNSAHRVMSGANFAWWLRQFLELRFVDVLAFLFLFRTICSASML